MCGGKSMRMGRDKSLLEYHGLPQREHLYRLLSGLCDKVYTSCNEAQFSTIPQVFNPLCDDSKYGDIGPMAGLLTAFQTVPNVSFLIVGCDYPFLERRDLEALIGYYQKHKASTVYLNRDTSFIEPLLAVYYNNLRSIIINEFERSQHSLRRILEQENVYRLPHPEPWRLRSVDDPDSYEKILRETGPLS